MNEVDSKKFIVKYFTHITNLRITAETRNQPTQWWAARQSEAGNKISIQQNKKETNQTIWANKKNSLGQHICGIFQLLL